MADRNGYIGRAPGDSSVIIASQTFEPSGIQTSFTFASGYDPGYIDVYLNGARLIYATDYVATDGVDISLTEAAINGDILECVAYKAFNVATIDSAPGNLTVGNKLTVSGVTTATSAYYTGIVTASSFSGDGSGLTGVASTDNIITGTAVTITNTTNSTSTTTGALIISGGVGVALSMTVGGSLSVGGTITYEDVTNQDVLGLSTFRSGVQFGVAGVGGTIRANGDVTLAGVVTATTFDGNLTGNQSGGTISATSAAVSDLTNNRVVIAGSSGELEDSAGLTYNGTRLDVTTGDLQVIGGSGSDSDIRIVSDQGNAGADYWKLTSHNDTNQLQIQIYYTGAWTGIATISKAGMQVVSGISSVGSAITMYASSGIVSATAFYGDGSQLEGVSASGGGGDLNITSCLFI